MDMPKLDAWSLHCLIVLVRESNVTRAGAALELSQPAASAILARLRDVFHDPILVKSSSGMIPTPRALELAARAEGVLEEIRDMVSPPGRVFDPAKHAGSVNLAATDIVRLLVLPDLMRALQEEAPNLKVSVHHADRIRIHEWLERADIDFGVGPRVVSTGRMRYRELWCDSAVCLTRQGTAHARRQMALEEFAGLGHIRIMPSRPSYYDDLLERELNSLGLRRRVVLTEKSFLMLPELVASTDLVVVVPRRFGVHACQDGGLEMFEPPVPLAELSIGLYWHERTHRSPLFQWLRGRLAELSE